MSSGKGKVLIVYERPSSFVQSDMDSLKDDFDVEGFEYGGKIDIISLTKGIVESDVVLSWFALGYSTTGVFLSRLLGRKSIVIAGGWDVVHMPEIDYGALKSEERIRKTRFALEKANRVLAVSESTKKDVLKLVDRDVEVLYLGFDPDKYKPAGEKEDIIVTVSNVNERTIKLKGLETFARCASSFPDHRFVVIGSYDDDSVKHLNSISSPNLEFPGYVTSEDLIKFYQKAKVYCQLSYQESFGASLAESMLCECTPVVTGRGAIPEVVGDIGYSVEYDDVEATVKAIGDGVTKPRCAEARSRIIDSFHIDRRKERFVKIIEELIS
jgi:glycosyltransferase involved in cell wall biosynthesis